MRCSRRRAGAIAGRLRMTEQGEQINAKYGLRGIAIRSLEQTLSSVLLVTARPPAANPAEPGWQSIMEEIAAASRGAYQSLLYGSGGFHGLLSRRDAVST